MPTIILQQIIVRWTKQSRGGANATKRNAVADAFPLDIPAHDFPFALVHHQLNFNEDSNFESPEITINVEPMHPPTSISDLACMKFDIQAERVIMQPLETMACLGAPPRNLEFKRIQLAVGQWGRLMLNGRFGFANAWSYQKSVTNIAFVEAIDHNIFLGEPDQFIQMMADLW